MRRGCCGASRRGRRRRRRWVASNLESGRTPFGASRRALSGRRCWHDGRRALVWRRWERRSSTRRATRRSARGAGDRALHGAARLEFQGFVLEVETRAALQRSLGRARLVEMSKGEPFERLGRADVRYRSELRRESVRELLRHAVWVRLLHVEAPDEDARHALPRRAPSRVLPRRWPLSSGERRDRRVHRRVHRRRPHPLVIPFMGEDAFLMRGRVPSGRPPRVRAVMGRVQAGLVHHGRASRRAAMRVVGRRDAMDVVRVAVAHLAAAAGLPVHLAGRARARAPRAPIRRWAGSEAPDRRWRGRSVVIPLRVARSRRAAMRDHHV